MLNIYSYSDNMKYIFSSEKIYLGIKKYEKYFACKIFLHILDIQKYSLNIKWKLKFGEF